MSELVERLEPGDPERIGEFWLAGRLGAGGQGVVYEAYGPDGARVAVKVLHGAGGSSRELEQMAAEARAAQRVASFCTARIVQVRLKPPRPYIVSEYIDGVSLQAAVAGGPGREPRLFAGDELHRLGIGIATALTAIHQARVVHRDLKPGNVMLGPDGPRLIDFGIARMVETHSATQAGGFTGTLRYMPPEVYAGQRAGAEADVFAWGAIMVFAATGRHAFTGNTLPAIAHQVRTHHPDLSVLPEPLRALVAAALDKDPLRRPSARAILTALTGDPHQDTGLEDLMNLGSAQAAPHTGWEPGDPALGKLAEDVYTTLPPEDRHLVPEVFLRCVIPGEGGGWSLHPVPAAELFDRDDPGDADALRRVVQAFTPLLAITGDQASGPVGDPAPLPGERIVLARPALPRAWPRLRDWLEQHRRDLTGHPRLRQAAHVWNTNGRRRSDVLTGAALDQAMHWATSGRPPRPNRTERALLDASHRAQATRTRRTRATALVLAVATLLSLTATGWALQAQRTATSQRDTATRQRDTVVSSQLVTRSEQAADPEVAALLAVASRRIQKTPENRARLLDILAKPERGTLTGHTYWVKSLAFSPDGGVLATASEDDTVRLWNTRTNQQIGSPLTGHTDNVNAVAFSPDGHTLATSSSDKTVRFWDARTHQQVGAPLTGSASYAGGVDSVAFSPDGGVLATVGNDLRVRLWDTRTRQQIGGPLTGHTDQVDAVAFSPDGNTLVTAGSDLRLWDARTHRQIGGPFTGRTDGVEAVAFSPDGNTLATADYDKTVRLWDVRTHRQVGSPFTGHTDEVTSVAFSPDGNTLASASFDKTVRLWDVRTHRQVGSPLTGHTGAVFTVAFSPDGLTLATGGDDKTVRLWNPRTHRQSGSPLTGHTDKVTSVAFSPDGKTLATASSDETVRLWDTRTRRQVGSPLTGHTKDVLSVAFSPDGKTLATGGYDGTVRLWDTRTHRQIGNPLTGHVGTVTTGHVGEVNAVVFSPDGKTLATGGSDTTVRLWDARTRQPIGTPLEGHTDPVESVAFSPDGRTLATAGWDHTVRLWDTRTHRPAGKPIAAHADYLESVAFSPDGKTLATASDDKTVRLWDTSTRQQIGTPLTGHTDHVVSVAFSPDGRTLATAGWDHTVRLWDTRTHQQIGTPLTGHTDQVNSVAFSPDGTTLATASDDHTVRLWDMAMPQDQDLVGLACRVAKRSLTRKEWAQYAPTGIEFQKACP
ncbi:serine/threonine-protein kinase [Actinomadura sp. NPDC048394]|uniref:serine/threonine-protein kinase n=1 Tax=Actinomadura sp. NPDC048394 TaxID=3158223 RepID=UPI0033F5F8E2